ncbi:MAG: hypothetical protein PHP23_13415 [Desulfobacterales bacterium]|nr:hypothetical protein [Desulfobacterales bacterium]MDD4072901.1 hypothetical protein [Desulfobacterales bacterium]MDD4393741.1 hypothetical protein [Desulfobacterales bacterium]
MSKNGYGSGTFFEARIFLSPAFLSLGQKGSSKTVSSCSAQVLILLLGKRQFGKRKDRKGIKKLVRTDGNRFTLTYKELCARHISQARATRAFDELLAKGFISVSHQGGAFDKDKNQYSLEDDFIKWRPGAPAIRVRKKDVTRGFQAAGAGIIAKQKAKLQHVSTWDTHTRVNEGHPQERHTCQQWTP